MDEQPQQQRKKKVPLKLLAMGLALLILFAGCYYKLAYEPSQLRKQCHEKALDKSNGRVVSYGRLGDSGGTQPSPVYFGHYEACKNSKGVK